MHLHMKNEHFIVDNFEEKAKKNILTCICYFDFFIFVFQIYAVFCIGLCSIYALHTKKTAPKKYYFYEIFG